jgi:hypothetical protein
VPATTSSRLAASVEVPSLVGLSFQEAQKIAYASGFRLEVESDGSGTLGPQAQQQPPPDMRVIRQSPNPKTLASPNTVIRVALGRSAKSAARLLLDRFVPSVYAAEARPQPRKQEKQPPSGAVTRRAVNTNSLTEPGTAPNIALDDDLIYVGCNTAGCGAMGRSGRIYKISNNSHWTFRQASFVSSTSTALSDLLLLSANDAGTVIAKSDGTNYVCSMGTPLWLSDTSKPLTCSETQTRVVTNYSEIVLAENQLSSGFPLIFERQRIGDSSQVDLLVGDSGFIATFPHDQATNLGSVQRQPSGTTARLRSSAFISGKGLVVGNRATILSTSNGGESWQHQTQGQEEAIPNHRFPAGWYWITAAALIVTCLGVVFFPAAPPATEFSVADWTVTDAPLRPGDLDSLDFTPMALGLSRFIRNPKTQPPVTIAIEGEWGQGKSSVMSLLRGDLECDECCQTVPRNREVLKAFSLVGECRSFDAERSSGYRRNRVTGVVRVGAIAR